MSTPTRFLSLPFVLGAVLWQAAPLGANVSPKNGNFYIGYTDVVYPGGFEPKIERVYNSKTPYKGVFGWGWGMDYEVHLKVSADGSVVVHEHGGGAENRFWPEELDPRELDASIERIVAAARAEGKFQRPADLIEYRAKLARDATFRNEEWQKFVDAGRVSPRTLREGTRLSSNRFSYQFITRTMDGYVRRFANGRLEAFNADGRLVRVEDTNQNAITFAYDDDGRLSGLTDNFGRSIRIVINERGLVERIIDRMGHEAIYRYNDRDQLVFTRDVDGNQYTHKYDARHNMVEIGYTDGTTMEIMYYPAALRENVQSVKDRDGTTTLYEYEFSDADEEWLAVNVLVRASDGMDISRSRYEYTTRRKVNGEEWTSRLVTVLDGYRTETIYNECCGLPLRIEQEGEVTTFEYDLQGRVTRKESGERWIVLSYEPQVGKVSRVEHGDTRSGRSTWATYRYDARGNLVGTGNSSGQSLHLDYDDTGRISRILEAQDTLSFTYNDDSKPVRIEHSSAGLITVTYTADGEIENVESPEGRGAAMRVTSLFQRLQALIRPASVTFTAGVSPPAGVSDSEELPASRRNPAYEAVFAQGASAQHPGLVAGRRVESRLSDASPALSEGGARYEVWSFTGHAGEQVTITLRSAAFDAMLVVGMGRDGEGEVLAEDDDGAGGTDSRILFEVPGDGEYLILVTSLGSSERGAYTLLIEPGFPDRFLAVAAEVAAGRVRTIQVAQALTDTLAPDDAVMDGGPFHLWQYHGRAGERLEVILTSSEFDTFLVLGTMADGRFVVLDSDDDGAGGTDSRIALELAEDGSYLILVAAFDDKAGTYTLRVNQEHAGPRRR